MKENTTEIKNFPQQLPDGVARKDSHESSTCETAHSQGRSSSHRTAASESTPRTRSFDDEQDFNSFDQEIYDTVSASFHHYELLVNYTALPNSEDFVQIWLKQFPSPSVQDRKEGEISLTFTSLIALKHFENTLPQQVKSSRLHSSANPNAGAQVMVPASQEGGDPAHWLHLLRQQNDGEEEPRCGSDKLCERGSDYFCSGSSADPNDQVMTQTQPISGAFTPDFDNFAASQSSVSELSAQPLPIGLNMGAAPFSYNMGSPSLAAPASMLQPFKGYQSAECKKQSFRLNLATIIEGRDQRTTVMIKNIPNKYTQKMLLERLDQKHFGRYDFFYLPIDLKNNCNVGYAFINMGDPIYIVSLFEDLAGQTWERFNSEKICELTYGRIQGKDALVDNFQSAVDVRKVKPAVFSSRKATAAEKAQIREAELLY